MGKTYEDCFRSYKSVRMVCTKKCSCCCSYHRRTYCSSPRRYTSMKRLGRAMAQAVSRLPPIAESRVFSWVSSCEICGGQSVTGAGLSPSSSVLPCQYHSTVLHTHTSYWGEKYVRQWQQLRDVVSPHNNRIKSMESHGGMILTGRNWITRRETWKSTTLSTTNPT
jgi:hypothetical protein